MAKVFDSQSWYYRIRVYILLNMEGSDLQKKMYSSLKRQKIFNVRKLPYKQFDNEKFLKGNCSPFSKQQPFKEHPENINNAKNMEYHYQLAIMTSPAYKELHNKYKSIKEQNRKEKEEKLKLLREKDEQLNRCIRESQRLDFQRERLLQKRKELKEYIEQLRYRRSIEQERYVLIQDRSQQYRIMNMEYLRNMMMAMHYQGGMDIDPDNMTYEELLQLQDKIGKVSKGLSEQQYKQVERVKASLAHEQELCSICYYNIKQQEQINCLPCKHIFHCDCIKEWLLKEKHCPMCKQELAFRKE